MQMSPDPVIRRARSVGVRNPREDRRLGMEESESRGVGGGGGVIALEVFSARNIAWTTDRVVAVDMFVVDSLPTHAFITAFVDVIRERSLM